MTHQNDIKLRARSYTRNFSFQKSLNKSPKFQRIKRIRLGYISSDFKTIQSHFLLRVIELHNRKNFKVYGYSIDPINDEMTKD